tara:strand:- start:1203 stop:1937 length:735 start_codon:yes stop_codon:yes gene_type:complete
MTKKVTRHREEYEQLKSQLREYYWDNYISWLENLQEEGYDVSKWETEEIIDTYIKENNLWKSADTIRESIFEAKEKKDNSYLETDMKKRKKNNEKAIADMKKVKDDTVPRWMREDVRRRLEEARRGPEDPSKAEKREKAEKSYASVKKRQKVLDKHEKDTGKKLDINKSVEGKKHKMNHPGSRQKPKVKGEKETELQQHNRRVSKHNDRLIKKGPTTKEKEKQAGYDAYEKKTKSKYGNKSVWD